MAAVRAEAEAAPPVETPQFAVYDVDTPTGDLPMSRTVATDSDASLAGKPIPYGMILFPRRVYYLQAILSITLASVCFATGYFMGKADAIKDFEIATAEQQKMRVPIEGRVFFDESDSKVTPDTDAVIMILPKRTGQQPLLDKDKIPFDQMRPDDPMPIKTFYGRRIIEEKLGGVYTRVNADGRFNATAPDVGNYFVLIISQNTIRPLNKKVNEADRVDMDRYFRDTNALIGLKKYIWKEYRVDPGFDDIEVDFGRNQQE